MTWTEPEISKADLTSMNGTTNDTTMRKTSQAAKEQKCSPANDITTPFWPLVTIRLVTCIGDLAVCCAEPAFHKEGG